MVDDLVKAMAFQHFQEPGVVAVLGARRQGEAFSDGQSKVIGYLCIDATYPKVRHGARIVSVELIIPVGVNSNDRREVLGLEIGACEAEPI